MASRVAKSLNCAVLHMRVAGTGTAAAARGATALPAAEYEALLQHLSEAGGELLPETPGSAPSGGPDEAAPPETALPEAAPPLVLRFAEVAVAVSAALSLQRMRAEALMTQVEPAPQVQIGIELTPAEPVERLVEGVKLAEQLGQLAGAGHLAVSAAAYGSLRLRQKTDFLPIGKQSFGGRGAAVQVYRALVLPSPSALRAAQAAAKAGIAHRHVAYATAALVTGLAFMGVVLLFALLR